MATKLEIKNPMMHKIMTMEPTQRIPALIDHIADTQFRLDSLLQYLVEQEKRDVFQGSDFVASPVNFPFRDFVKSLEA